jgi:nicotinamidase-related amidase
MNIETQRKELQHDEGGHDRWINLIESRDVEPEETAVLICDMWNKHWCRGATERVNALAPRINEFIIACRNKGITIIHAPSETLDFYENAPARRRAEEIKLIQPPIFIPPVYPSLPIDDSDGGSDTNQDGTEIPNTMVWTRQHPVVEIDDDVDYITDIGYEVYSLFVQKDIKHLAIAGVHTNMCVLGRSFAIKQMVGWHVDVMLVRDLTDAMYNPARSPYVNHDEGTRLVIEYIEKFLCPTVSSDDFMV